MKDNGTHPRPGTGCSPVEPEVMPADYYQPPGGGGLTIGRVQFDRTTTLQSPCFWLLLGAAGGGLLLYLILREKNR